MIKKEKTQDIYISIICPLYHGQKYVCRILELIERNRLTLIKENIQKEMEVIFVNDFPQEIISMPKDKFTNIKIKIIEPGINNGIHKSRVLGLKEAKGEYVLFLDQDDVISENYFESQLIHMRGKNAVLCNGYYQHNRIIYSSIQIQEKVVCLSEYLLQKDVIISPGQVLMRRNKIPEEWKCDVLSGNGSDDVLLWIIMMSKNTEFALNEEKIYWHLESDSNASYDYDKMRQSILELLGLIMKRDYLTLDQKAIFKNATEKRLQRYEQYIQLSIRMNECKKTLIQDKLRKYIDDRRVAIYGWGIFGREFWKIGKKAGINICFGIDMAKAAFVEPELPLYTSEEDFPEVDLIVVTAVTGFQKIKIQLESKCRARIVLLNSLLNIVEENDGKNHFIWDREDS